MTVISRQKLSDGLNALAREKTLIAPRDVQGVLLYRPVQSSAEIVWDYIRPVMSAKESFFPATERLLTIEKTGQKIILEEVLPEGEQVIFGLRSCDVRGLLALDALFIETEPADRYYARRREQTTLIGLACREMADTCFCTSVGGAPDDPTGMDVMIYPIEGGYQVRVLTEKGKRACDLSGVGSYESGTQSPNPLTPNSLATNPIYPIPTQDAWPQHFADPFWPAMSERCLSCRICAYVCPTCRCFDVRDEPVFGSNGNREYERIRCWDSCAGTVYRRIAGGHNPREAKGERLRNRFFCKFYYYPEQYGPMACTGCGRCIEACPVNIDITEVLEHVAKVAG